MEVSSIWKKLSKQRDDSDSVKNFYKQLEKSRAKLRSLEDMLIEDESQSAIQKQLLGHMSSIKEKTAAHIPEELKRKYQFKFELLEALLVDLKHAKLESAIERAWLGEMKDFLVDAEEAFNTFRQRKERKELYLFNYIFSMADSLLEIDLQWMDDELTKLLETKYRYGFKLIIIQHQTDPYQKQVRDNHDHILSVVNNVPEHDDKIRSLCNKLKEMIESLKAIEGASNFRMKCSEQMKTVADDLKKIVEKNNPTGNTSAWDSVLREIDNRTTDIKKFMDACSLVGRQSSSIIGLEEDTEKLVSRLTSTSEQCCFFFIVGMQGIGKTTLAKKIYYDEKILSHFSDGRIWVSVADDGNSAFLNEERNSITGNHERQKPEEVTGVEAYIQKIKDLLQKKCLVVLDNVSTKELCDKLKVAFSRSGNGSRFLLTTRDMTAGVGTEIDVSHPLRLRTKEESWQLFLGKVHFPPGLLSQNGELEIETKKIVRCCWGLPLTLSWVSFLMAGEAADAEVLVKTDEKAKQCKTLSENLQIDALPSHLKQFLSWITLFSKCSEIPVRRLVATWVAEGPVQQNSGNKDTLESIAQHHLSELIDWNIIQPLKKKVNGKVRTFCLPDPLLGMLTTFLIQPQRCVLSSTSSGRLAEGDKNVGIPQNLPPNYNENFVSLISFDAREGDKPGNDIENFLQKRIANGSFKELKVLDLERVFRPRLPKAIAKLVELRYLGLRWTYLEEIPSTIGSLLNLQTLDLKHTYIRILPNTIRKLQNLRHLYLNQTCRAKFVQKSKTESLLNLQTLWGVFLDGKSPLEGLFYGLNSLTKLELSLHLSSAQQEALAERIAGFTNLESLRLRSVSVMSEPRDLYLGNFSELKGLSNISLFGRLHNALSSSYFPDNLSELTLSASGLEYDPMQILRKLPELRSLCLFSDSFTGEHMICSSGWFSKLLVLKIWKLGNLEDWTIEEKAMENLKELEIRSCPNLKVPDGLRHLKTLRQLKLRNMPEKFSGECSLFVPLSIIETKQDTPRDEKQKEKLS